MALKEILAVSAWLFQEGADPVVKDRAAFLFLSSCSSHVAMRDVALASHFVFIEWGSFLTSDEVAWGPLSKPSCSFLSWAESILGLMSTRALGSCWTELRSRHISSIPLVIMLRTDLAVLTASSGGISNSDSSLAKDRGNHPDHVVRAPAFFMSRRQSATTGPRSSSSSSESEEGWGEEGEGGRCPGLPLWAHPLVGRALQFLHL